MLRPKNLHHFVGARHFSGPPLKRYSGLKNWPQLFWHTQVPAPAKLFSGILAGALSLTHIHPNTLATVGPPLLVGAFFANRRLNHARYLRLVEIVRPKNASDWDDNSRKVRIWKYNEADVANVVRGLENSFEHYQAQMLELVAKKIVDFAIDHDEGLASRLVALFLDENRQVVVHLGENLETFVATQAEVVAPDGSEHISEFQRFSVAIYSSKNVSTRKRLGVADVSVLSVPVTDVEAETDYQDYRISIDITPFELWGKTERVECNGDEIASIDTYRNRTDG